MVARIGPGQVSTTDLVMAGFFLLTFWSSQSSHARRRRQWTMKRQVELAAGVALIASGLCIVALGGGTLWSYAGLLPAAFGGAITGTWLRNKYLG